MSTESNRTASQSSGQTTSQTASPANSKTSAGELGTKSQMSAPQASQPPGQSASATSATTAAPAASAAPQTEPQSQAQAQGQETTIRGRSVFTVETTPAGVVIRTAWMSEDNKLMEMPAVFPDMLHALSVLDDLRQQVIQHFSQAAQVGSQVIFNQMQEQQRLQAEKAENAGNADSLGNLSAPEKRA